MEINDLTHVVIGCAYKVHQVLGFGFRESIYENALHIELSNQGIVALQQERVNVFYDGRIVGVYRPDLWLPDRLIIEIKSMQKLAKEHEIQLVNYLTATNVDDGLLINFGASVEVRRKFRIYTPTKGLRNSLADGSKSL